MKASAWTAVSGTGLKVSGRAVRQHNSCGNMATHGDSLRASDMATLMDDDVFNSPPSTASRRRLITATASAAVPSPSHAGAASWMRPRAGSSVAGLASTSPPQMTLKDIRKVARPS